MPACLVTGFVEYLLNAKTVEPEKQPLQANGSETTFLSNGRETDNATTSAAKQKILNKREWTAAARERFDKHVPAPTDSHVTEEMSYMSAKLGLLTLWEKHRLRVFENRVLRRIFGPKRDEVTGD
jgi:hypothetical protein